MYICIYIYNTYIYTILVAKQQGDESPKKIPSNRNQESSLLLLFIL